MQPDEHNGPPSVDYPRFIESLREYIRELRNTPAEPEDFYIPDPVIREYQSASYDLWRATAFVLQLHEEHGRKAVEDFIERFAEHMRGGKPLALLAREKKIIGEISPNAPLHHEQPASKSHRWTAALSGAALAAGMFVGYRGHQYVQPHLTAATEIRKEMEQRQKLPVLEQAGIQRQDKLHAQMKNNDYQMWLKTLGLGAAFLITTGAGLLAGWWALLEKRHNDKDASKQLSNFMQTMNHALYEATPDVHEHFQPASRSIER